MRKKLLLIMVLVCTFLAYSKIWFVSMDGDDQNSGESWEHSFRNIRRACYYVENNDSIYVMAGTYFESDLKIPSFIHVLGGFDGTEHSYLERDFINNKTCIDMDGNLDLSITNTGNLDGFYIQNGGSILNLGSMQNCRICFNIMKEPYVVRNRYGGIVRGCHIYNNKKRSGYYHSFSSALLCKRSIVENCLIYSNDANGICAGDGTEVRYVTSVGNEWHGIIGGSSGSTVSNSIFVNNHTEDIDFSSDGTVDHCCYQIGTIENGFDNMVADPLFLNVQGKYDTWDLHLQSNSPCIDAGVPVENITLDIAGISRPFGAGVDMGAYEYYFETAVPGTQWMCFQ